MIRKLLSWVFIAVISFTGCGSGGGDSSSPSILYSGSTAEAPITSGNARDISMVAWMGGSFASSMDLAGSVETERTAAGHSLATNLPQALKEILNKINLSPEKLFTCAAKSISDTLTGDCGGKASFSLRYDDQTGFFSGTLAFHSYCTANTTLTGNAEFSGFVSLDTGKFISLALLMNTITAVAGNERYTLKGDFQAAYATSPRTITYDVLAKDDVSGKVYWWNNLMLQSAGESEYTDLSLSGRIYHPDYGYVTVSTATPFRIDPADTAPSSGILLITGKAGSAGDSTSACFTALSATSYTVCADTDGNGFCDWSSGTLYW